MVFCWSGNLPVLVIHQRNRFYQYLHSFEYLVGFTINFLIQHHFNVIDPMLICFFNGDLDLFWHIVCFSTVLWVIIVEVSLSDCLSGQLHSHYIFISLLHYFSHSFTIDCFVGLALPHLANNLI